MARQIGWLGEPSVKSGYAIGISGQNQSHAALNFGVNP
jgi:hypothetical protein